MPYYTGGVLKRNNKTIDIKREENKGKLLHLGETLKRWDRLGHEIIIVYPSPDAGTHIPKAVLRSTSQYWGNFKKQHAFQKIDLSTDLDYQKIFLYKSYQFLDHIEGDNIKRIYPMDIFCSKLSKRCKTHSKKNIYYTDENHFSAAANKLLFQEIENHLF
jgi:vacuolar-type H+-ATPase catalytic subunit A/Vma1